MGAAAGLFFSADGEDDTLYSRIVPSDEQTSYLRERWNELAERLIADLTERSGYPIRTWLQGSYKMATVIRPVNKFEEYDVDLGVYYCWGPNEGAVPAAAQIKNWTRDSLTEFAQSAEDVKQVEAPPRERCERIQYEKQFHIDVPSYHLDEDKDQRRLATGTKGWEASDPKAFYVWFKDEVANPERTELRRTVRYLKAWAAIQFGANPTGRPTSVLLTVLATEAYLELEDDMQDDEDVFCAVATSIRDRLEVNSKVPNPVNRGENLNRLSEEELGALMTTLDTLVDACASAQACDDEGAAALVWDEVFDHLFPLPEGDASILFEKAVGGAVALAPVIHVDVRDASGAPLDNYVNEVPRVPKNCHLRFRIANPEVVPEWATVDWVVRNAGAEALAINDLGHARRGARALEHEEHTAYTGRHFMDCIVRNHGKAIAATRVPVYVVPPAFTKPLPAKPWYRRFVRRRGP